jgi:hypothetical protein
MISWGAAMEQIAEEDAEARLLWSFRRGREEFGPARTAIARLAERALKGSQSAVGELAAELRALGHPEAERVARLQVEYLT